METSVETTKKFRYTKVILLVVILLFPSVLYLILSTGKHNVARLQVYGPREAVAGKEGDTLYHTLPAFEFVNHYGNKIGSNDVKDKIIVADFFFTTCQTICPKMSTNMSGVQEKVQEMKDVVLLSFTVDPETDTVETLRDYAQKMGAKEGRWHFLTGDKKQLYDLARNGFFITAMEGDGGPDDFIHSEKLVLLDKKGRIRGYYDGTDNKEIKRLTDEIRVLKAEEQIPFKKK